MTKVSISLPPTQARRIGVLALTLASTLSLLAACSKPLEKVEEIRPVRAIQLSAAQVDVVAEFSGEVRPRIESRLGFRVGGKIVSRKVDPGAIVHRGQALMQLDPQDLQLAQSQSRAGLQAAESNRDLARAELKRYQELRDKNFVSQAVLDGKETAFKAAQASFDQASAGFANQSNQTAYTTLFADADGVVTGVDADVGQVVAAGTPVVRLAQGAAKEIVIGIPEGKVDVLRKIPNIRVRMWAKPEQSIAGTLRELSPIADPATRTYTAKIAIPSATDEVRLGMTAYVGFVVTSPVPVMKVPLTALMRSGSAEKEVTSVWVIENGAVRLVPVTAGGVAGNEVLLVAGVTPGQIVVTAGVNQLKPGQHVKVIDENGTAILPSVQAAGGAATSGTGTGKTK